MACLTAVYATWKMAQWALAPGKGRKGDAMGALQERLTVNVPEAAKLLGISERSAYEAVRRGEVPAVRVGGRWLVPRAALERLLSGVRMAD
jgi:excisionase family DNA binding protein